MRNFKITVNGVEYDVTVEEKDASSVPAAAFAPAQHSAPAAPAVSAAKGSVKVDAPMPGNILDIKVSAGAKVKKGEVLAVLEAMKMENDIVSPDDGTVASVEVNKGDTVEAGQTLITLS